MTLEALLLLAEVTAGHFDLLRNISSARATEFQTNPSTSLVYFHPNEPNEIRSLS